MESRVFRHRRIWTSLLIAVTLSLIAQVGLAASLTDLQQGLTWGMTREQVEAHHKDALLAAYHQKTKGSRDILHNDRLRKKVDDDAKDFHDTWVSFDGARSGYAASAIAHEVYTGAGLAMLILKDADNPRYLVFKNGHLQKIIVAMNVAALGFIPFHAFIDELAESYGKPKDRQTRLDDLGITRDVRAIWKKGKTRLRVENRHAVYNTFLMVLTDAHKPDFMRTAKAKSSAGAQAGGSLDDIFAAAQEESAGHSEANVVDQLTGSESDVTVRLRSDAQRGDVLTSQAGGSSAMDDTEVLEDVPKLTRQSIGGNHHKSRPSKPKKSPSKSSGSGGGRTIY